MLATVALRTKNSDSKTYCGNSVWKSGFFWPHWATEKKIEVAWKHTVR